MPEGAPIVKEKATRAYGADVRFVGATVDESLWSPPRSSRPRPEPC